MTTFLPTRSPVSTALDIRAEAIEQVMRLCDDDLTVLEMLDIEPGSQAAAASLGRLMHTHPVRLLAGCPLISWVSGAGLDRHWRRAYPPKAHSLYEQLEFLTAIYGDDTDTEVGTGSCADSYTLLETLRHRSEAA